MPPPRIAFGPAQMLASLAIWSLVVAFVFTWVSALDRLRRRVPLLPNSPPRIVPWGASSVMAVVLLYFVVNVAAGFAYVAATGTHGPFSPKAQLVILAMINGGMLVSVPLALRLTSGARLADFGIGQGPIGPDVRRGVAGCLLMAPVVFTMLGGLTKVWKPRSHPMEDMLRADPGGSILLLAFLSGVVLAPAAEELIFRGVLQGWLTRVASRGRLKPAPTADDLWDDGGPIDPSPWAAPRAPLAESGPPRAPGAVLPNVITSMLFAAMHWGQWPAPIPLFFLSLALGHLYRRTGGVVAPIAMHAAFNGLSTAILLIALHSGAKPPADLPRPEPARAGAASRNFRRFSSQTALGAITPKRYDSGPFRILSRRVPDREAEAGRGRGR